MQINKTNNKSFDPTNYADPLFGVGSATSAGPTLPSGSIHPSPETLKNDCGGYLREQPIVGFGHAYTSGSGGTKCYGNFLLAPMVGNLEIEREKRASFAKEESSSCFEYKVELENGIRARVAPAHASAIYSFSYPTDKDAYLLIDVSHKLDIDASMKKGSITVDPKNKSIAGGGRFFGNWNNNEWDMFFAMEFDADFEEIGVFEGAEIHELSKEEQSLISIDTEKRLGAFIKFAKGAQVKVKIAISFVSEQKAKSFLLEQIPDFDYERVKEMARDAWRGILGAIQIKTEDKALLRRFYTAIYHMNIQPRDRTLDSGNWDDFHTVWDSWKTAFPMRSLLYTENMGAIIDSFIDRAKENERLGNGIVIADEFLAGTEGPAGQGGNDVDNVIVDAYLKGVSLKKYTWEDAYSVLLKSAEQMRSPEYVKNGFATKNNRMVSGASYTWRFKPASATLGFALNDKAIANMSLKMGKIKEYEKYEKRSANWLNMWNPKCESEGFYGFPQTCNEDGTFDDGFDAHGGYNTDFYEATGWDASYINYNDVPRLVQAMGGAETFTKRLIWACEHSVNYYNDDHGKEGYLNFTNEPSFHIPWLFCTDEVKRPDLAAKVIDGVIKRFSKQNDYPGDEDNGGMASYYLFMMCGFFPYATTENYYLHGTRLEEIVMHLGNGKDLRITGENVGDNNIYVQSATWQGEVLNECKLTHSQILEGGELHFVMGDKPSNWAQK
ncbi:MAG: hypothetical protein E7347_05785 [Clostridiales bacterium]|nr:hypothetical protein [Clostridiales bacterium]